MAVVAIPVHAFTQEPPDEMQLAKGIAETLPAWMRVEDLEITASATSGDAVNPLIRNRMIASVSNREPLYRQTFLPDHLEEFAPADYELIEVITKADTEVSLYGISHSYISMGAFRTEFEFENMNAINILGRPKDFFDPAALVVGSKEAARFQAEVQVRADDEEARLEELLAALSDRLPGVWKGEYLCGQGSTGLTVTINDIATLDGISGVFHFYGIERNANDVPDGKYEIAISYDDAENILVARPRAWIEKPSGYQMVGFTTRLSADEMEGSVNYGGCGSLRLVRSQTENASLAVLR
ncbi:hypothetical protein Q4511_14130 [Paracoccus sp. 1_MG-2023]|uniref:hypothetical protein n=1 Tax=unclassified Paracoccus (in: a-proteobacteria) TaxID=2688777 RepID=UPI001C0806EC|nr:MULTISPECIES: hypothetical protein [unclassified Paracoccus (in: a-proteobacteria)]MBU2959198.1 hypothetical protein [Paracoccus sp. C2R09]MDO6670065.1 hypothetical protein [Paracoccus sp. 1_MG-2023]